MDSCGASPQPRYPSLYEINTRAWLTNLTRQAGKPVTLADIDDAILDELAQRGFDWIWLLSVWQTGKASRAVSRSIPTWRVEFQVALSDLTEEDICGSGFAIKAYEVDEALGGEAALAEFRARLATRGIRLMLDFVPNHTALDHPWVKTNPEFYIEGDEQALSEASQNYRRVQTNRGARILAHGRDPNFPGWPDTLQLNYANPTLQAAQTAELAAIANRCDGVRCDMAMLLLPQVFRRTWGLEAAPFWPNAIEVVRLAHPGFTFLAEAYWDLEWELQQQGFDYCYDKRLYDRLRDGDGNLVRAHLAAGMDYQARLARFLENHDEPRAAATFSSSQQRAAAIVTYFAPGLRFFHEGQLTGARVRVSTHLCRMPIERSAADVLTFYEGLLGVIGAADVFRNGTWSLIAPQPAWHGNPTWRDLIPYAWHAANGDRYAVVVNYSNHQAQCYLPLPFADMRGGHFLLVDVMGRERYSRDGDDLIVPGLYVDLGAWHYNVFKLEPIVPLMLSA